MLIPLDAAQVKKRYHKPLTPCDRLLTDARVDAALRQRVAESRADFDPIGRNPQLRSARLLSLRKVDCA